MKQIALALAVIQTHAIDFTKDQIQETMLEYFELMAGDSPIYREKVTQGKPWLHLQSSNGKCQSVETLQIATA